MEENVLQTQQRAYEYLKYREGDPQSFVPTQRSSELPPCSGHSRLQSEPNFPASYKSLRSRSSILHGNKITNGSGFSPTNIATNRGSKASSG